MKTAQDKPDPQADPLRAVWEFSEPDGGGAPRLPAGGALVALAVVFALAVGVAAYLVIQKSEGAITGLLVEKGSSLLRALESALRVGMRGQEGLPLQTLLNEMSKNADIEFVAVTMPDGVIIAHSDVSRIGESLGLEGAPLDAGTLAQMAPGDDEKWRIAEAEGGRVFLLYRHFTLGRQNWPADVPEPTIFLGLDAAPMEIASAQNRSYIIMLCAAILLVGGACLLAAIFSKRALESRKKQRRAEGEVARMEKEMRRQEKLAAIGTLAAGVAHEIRNPLSSIKGYATYFRQKFPEDSEDREAADVMLSEVNRLNRVISDLLGLSAQGSYRLKPTDLRAVAEHALRLLRRDAAKRGVVIEAKFAREIPLVMADMERINQALLNLCLNAFEAMPNGGLLTVAVSGGRRRACLVVRDSGSGIPPEIMGKIFDPYFTTKGSGTGLGLPMVHKIARGHNGEIDARSRPASGGEHGETIFRIWIPAAE